MDKKYFEISLKRFEIFLFSGFIRAYIFSSGEDIENAQKKRLCFRDGLKLAHVNRSLIILNN